jgi:hypothetical protein
MLEEQERTRRMSEAEEEEKMDSDISRAVTGTYDVRLKAVCCAFPG